MSEPSLLVVCATAFVAVLLLLSFLAGVIRILMAVFPDEDDTADSALVAAISSAAAAAHPGTKVTGVEEVQ